MTSSCDKDLLLLLLQASDGIETLRRNVDTLIVIPNDRSAAFFCSPDSRPYRAIVCLSTPEYGVKA